ncbi:hypothetical protein [Ammoniphilus resinae]|nr:hypothetical protein [Ammoniphilus resinae]
MKDLDLLDDRAKEGYKMNNTNTTKCGCDMGIERMVNEGGLGAELSYPQLQSQSMGKRNGTTSKNKEA